MVEHSEDRTVPCFLCHRVCIPYIAVPTNNGAEKCCKRCYDAGDTQRWTEAFHDKKHEC